MTSSYVFVEGKDSDKEKEDSDLESGSDDEAASKTLIKILISFSSHRVNFAMVRRKCKKWNLETIDFVLNRT